ncbi:MAG: hypothetical protein QF805_28670, partial [Pirellulaceae bacterium]|nr:hypothetical protein [Pirellulaceae bacterium]
MPNTYQIDEKSGLLQENIFFAIDSPFEGFVSSIEDDWIIGGTRHQDGFDYQVDSASARAITVKWRETGKCSFTACCTRQKVLEKL